MQVVNKNLGLVPDWYFDLNTDRQRRDLGFIMMDDGPGYQMNGVEDVLSLVDWYKQHKNKILIGLGGVVGLSFISALLK